MVNCGCCMEAVGDAVAGVVLDDGTALRFCKRLDDATDLAVRDAWSANIDRCIQTFSSDTDELHRLGIFLRLLADGEGCVEVAVVALVKEGDIDVENVAVFQRSLIGDAVADDLVDGAVFGGRMQNDAKVSGGDLCEGARSPLSDYLRADALRVAVIA